MAEKKEVLLDPVGNIIEDKARQNKVIHIDFADNKNEIRALNGLNNGPGSVVGKPDKDLIAWWEVLNVPMTRLHDTVYGGNPDTVDIHCIFPDFSADPDDPANYHFARTDKYIKAIVELGVQIVYRLGESIDHSVEKCYIDPPADFVQWAKICIGIIRHYNDGWAEGYQYGITHWEVWCEPDGPGTWSGTFEQYCELYDTAAKAIKEYDATLKVGGPSGLNAPAMQKSFLDFCRSNETPLDFFSTHGYARSALTLKKKVEQAHNHLEEYGFDNTECHFNEWHYFPGEWSRLNDPFYSKKLFEHANGSAGAAFITSFLIMIQDTAITMANYFTGDRNGFGLFDMFGVPHKTYYAFKAFAWLLEMKTRIGCDVLDYQVEALAGSNNAGLAILLLSNFDDKENEAFSIQLQNEPFRGPVSYEIYVVDDDHNLDQVSRYRISTDDKSFTVACPAPSIRLIKLFW